MGSRCILVAENILVAQITELTYTRGLRSTTWPKEMRPSGTQDPSETKREALRSAILQVLGDHGVPEDDELGRLAVIMALKGTLLCTTRAERLGQIPISNPPQSMTEATGGRLTWWNDGAHEGILVASVSKQQAARYLELLKTAAGVAGLSRDEITLTQRASANIIHIPVNFSVRPMFLEAVRAQEWRM
jgi:hypothetical protein